MAWSVHDGAITRSQAVHGTVSQGGGVSYEGTPGLEAVLPGGARVSNDCEWPGL